MAKKGSSRKSTPKKDTVKVKSHKRDGSSIPRHVRTSPDKSKSNNLSSK